MSLSPLCDEVNRSPLGKEGNENPPLVTKKLIPLLPDAADEGEGRVGGEQLKRAGNGWKGGAGGGVEKTNKKEKKKEQGKMCLK